MDTYYYYVIAIYLLKLTNELFIDSFTKKNSECMFL